MEIKTKSHDAEFLSLHPLRFILNDNPDFELKDVKQLTPVHKPGEEMETYVRKLIAHLNESK